MGHVNRRLVVVGIAASFTAMPMERGFSATNRNSPPAANFGPIRFTSNTPAHRASGGRAARLINHIRKARNRPSLRYHGTLQRIASRQARAMARKDEMSHHVAGALPTRARSAGYRGKPAENLARQYETLEDVLLAWLRAPSHRTTLLSKRYRYYGLSVARTSQRQNSKYKVYWALVVGT